MAQREDRISQFIVDGEPETDVLVELLCEDHVGTYTLPFPCRREKGDWTNAKTGDAIVVDVLGWRLAYPPLLKSSYFPLRRIHS